MRSQKDRVAQVFFKTESKFNHVKDITKLDAMAQFDDDITDLDQPSPLEQSLTCTICTNIYEDPVLLSCTHSFCGSCLKQCWRSKGRKECPVCRHNCENEEPILNRVLKDTCESFKRGKGYPVVPGVSELVCGFHNRPFQVFCVKDETPVCVECLPLHPDHTLIPLDQGLPLCKNELTTKVNILEERIESFKRTKRRYMDTISFIQRQSEIAEKSIRNEFDRLHKFLQTEEDVRIQALKKEEEQKKEAMNEKVKVLNQDLNALQELLDSLRREMGAEDLNFLLKFNKLKQSAQWTDEGPQRDPGELIHVARHSGAVSYKIWQKMLSHVNCLPVILDPNTVSPWLEISPDFSSIKASPQRLEVPENVERFDPCVFALGSEGFGAGRHRWDVNVGDNPKWVLGVCKESVVRKRKFTVAPKASIWTIGLSKGVYSGLTLPRTEIKVEQRPEVIRIKLNMDKGQVSFWDASHGIHLLTYTDKFPSRLYPIFGPGLCSTPMTILPAKVTVHQQ